MKQRLKTVIAFAVLFAAAVGSILLSVFPIETGDIVLDRLFSAVLPRAFIAVGLGAIVAVAYRKLLIFPKIKKDTLIFFLPCLLVPLANFPVSALISGKAIIERYDLIWLFLIKCLLIAAIEEFLFRGILLDFTENFLKNKNRKDIPVILITSAIFAVFHLFNLIDGTPSAVFLQVCYSLPLGCMLAAVYVKTRNIWGCILLHALFDIGGLIITDLGYGNTADLIFIIVTAVCGMAVAAHIIYGLLRR